MFNMFELFRQAQGGAAFDNLARAYGMSAEQMRAAAAALTPAFAKGFQRQAQSDDAARRFTELFQTETYARAFEAQATALDPAARSAGENALGALFGSKEVSRAVAAQAAAASGVQAEIIRKVLPELASILIGGFVKATEGAASQGGGASAFPNPVADFWSQILRGVASGVRSDSPKSGPGPQNPFQDWLSGFGGAAAGTAKPGDAPTARPGQAPPNPMGDMMAEMLNGMFGGGGKPQPGPSGGKPQPGGGGKPQAEATPGEPPVGAGDATRPEGPAAGNPFDDFVETGRELSAQNAKAMERIFDTFFGDKPKG